MPAGCKVCLHKDVEEINRDLVLHSISGPKVAAKYGLTNALIHKHKPHITQKLALAQERREHLAADRLLDDTEMLWRESLTVLDQSKKAVKTMAVTEGQGKNARTSYREYKDLAPMMAAIKVCHDNRKLYGEAAGVLPNNQGGGQTGIFLSISMPRMEAPTPTEGPTIEATVLSTVSSPVKAERPPRPPKLTAKQRFIKSLSPRIRAAAEKAEAKANPQA